MAGRVLSKTDHFVLHCCGLDAPDLSGVSAPKALLFPSHDVWLGAMVPKRWARRAVTRNAIKRQVYSISLQAESGLKQQAHVVRLRTAFDKAQFVSASSSALKAAVRTELIQLFAMANARSSLDRGKPRPAS
ncbi:ribonuclease P protein component [Rhodoferax aquaticus]